MKAVIYNGVGSVSVESVAAPRIEESTDALVRVTATSICGSDIRFYWGTMLSLVPLVPGDPLGHEFVGLVEEVGRDVRGLHVGQRVVSPFSSHCGVCFYCKRDLLTRCENIRGFGLSKAWGDLGGGQAEYVRVPAADRTLLALDDRVSDEEATVLADVMSGVFAGMEFLRGGETVAVLGCGPTGLSAVMCAQLQGAAKVLAIDHHADRLARAAGLGAIPINFDEEDPVPAVKERTEGRGVDVAADAVGKLGSVNVALGLVRPFGTLVLLGFVDPAETCSMGSICRKQVTIRPALVPPVRRYQHRVMNLIAEKRLDPSVLLTHVLPLNEAPKAYEMMSKRLDGAIKLVLKP